MLASDALQGQFLIQVRQLAKQLAQVDKHFQTEDASVQLDSIWLEQHADFVKSGQFTTLLGYRATKPVPIQTATSKTVDVFATLHTLLLMKQYVSYAQQTQPTICHHFRASHQHLQTMWMPLATPPQKSESWTLPVDFITVNVMKAKNTTLSTTDVALAKCLPSTIPALKVANSISVYWLRQVSIILKEIAQWK
jgi:hypothetical protein